MEGIQKSNDKCEISNNDLLEINKPIPITKINSFDKIYSEYLITSQDKKFDISNSNFNPNNNSPPNKFVSKLESRIKMYYNHS
jgi:hypothetical protein